MKKILSLFTVMAFFMTLATAQDKGNPCGTVDGRSPWLKQYQAQPQAFAKGGDTTMYIAMSVHILGTDAGGGYYSVNSLLNAFCKLNELYAPVGIQFYQAGDIDYINNSAYYNHETVLVGGEMMFEHNVPNTLNTYFVNDPASNCGYNLPYAGIANAKSCSGANDVTWAHEVGHALSLPHPFLGWEGGVEWDGSVDHDFSDPAPEQATIDYTFFQDTLILDTLIIDTILVEKVDGSNCTIAADGFCDTAPDYLAGRWNCNADGVSSQFQHDPNGVSFQSDGSLIMSYADDACQTRFSPDQQDAMRAFLLDERATWISPVSLLSPVDGMPMAILPTDGEDIIGEVSADLSWDGVDNATHYLVLVSRLSSYPGGLTTSYVTTETFLSTEELLDAKTYHWKVKGFNSNQFCNDFNESQTFTIYHPEVLVNDIVDLEKINIFPQPVSKNQALNIQLEMTNNWSGQLEIKNQLGQIVYKEDVEFYTGSNTHQVNLNNLSKGIYWLAITNGAERLVKKIIVQ